MTASAEKSKTPMIWPDTSVLVDFAKVERGEKIEPVRAKRLTRLTPSDPLSRPRNALSNLASHLISQSLSYMLSYENN